MATSTDQALAYCPAHANEFANSTRDVEFSAMRQRFTTLLAPRAAILDFGRGSGRDTPAFLKVGLDVTATDSPRALPPRP